MKKGVPPEIIRKARMKLISLDNVQSLRDLENTPGNHLRKLKEKKGFHSITVQDEYKVIFRWKDGNAYDVEFTYPHK